MKKTVRKDDLEQVLTKISAELDSGRTLMPEQYIERFQVDAKKVCEQLDAVMDERRVLKLGVVGEVKAGKSSFLNALLFDGQDILPKAPTPMTAALTRLSYSESPEARIHFYNRNDWNAICIKAEKYDEALNKAYGEYCASYDERKKKHDEALSKADEKYCASKGKKSTLYDVWRKPAPKTRVPAIGRKKTRDEFERSFRATAPLDMRSCKELRDMASDLDVWQYLSDEPVVLKMDEMGGEYKSELQEYVGAGGKFTPIVKYTEIQMDNEMLKGFEVVDTPGLNDPILSRSRTTEQFLIQCDAVFLLSYAGQFCGEEDINFITSVLPNEGIQYAVLLGSKLDSGILDFPAENCSFSRAKNETLRSLEHQARNNLQAYQQRNGSSPLLEMLLGSQTRFVSSLMYSASRHKATGQALPEEETHVIEQFMRRFTGFRNDADFLADFANIDAVRETSLREVRDNKERILEDRRRDIVRSQAGRFLSQLEDLNIQVGTNYAEFKSTDIESLEQKIQSIIWKLTSVRRDVKSIFDECAAQVASSVNRINVEVMKECKNHLDIIVGSYNDTIRHVRTTGILFWKEEHVEHEHVTHHSANVSDLQNNISEYVARIMEIVNNRFESILKIEELKSRLQTAVMGVFDVNDIDFDENLILAPVKSALQAIIIPQLDFSSKKYFDMIDQKLGGVITNAAVKDRDIPLMLRAQSEIFEEIKKDAEKRINEQGNNVRSKIEEQSTIFIDNIEGEVQENADKLRALLKAGRESAAQFDTFLKTLREAKSQLQGMV